MKGSAPHSVASRPVRGVCVLGVVPPRGRASWDPGASATRRLAALAGVTPEELRERFALDDLLPYSPSGDDLTADGRPSRELLTEAASLYRFLPGWWYLLAGTEVVRAFGCRVRPDMRHAWDVSGSRIPWHGSGPLEWYVTREQVVAAVLPHPSGKNRWYDDARCRAAAEKFVCDAAGSRRGAHACWLADARAEVAAADRERVRLAPSRARRRRK